MKSMPAASAMRASARQSGQLADQRSGTKVAERPDEQLAPNSPILSWLALYIAMRSRIDAVGVSAAAVIPAPPRHCEERSDEAISATHSAAPDCFASLAMTSALVT